MLLNLDYMVSFYQSEHQRRFEFLSFVVYSDCFAWVWDACYQSLVLCKWTFPLWGFQVMIWTAKAKRFLELVRLWHSMTSWWLRIWWHVILHELREREMPECSISHHLQGTACSNFVYYFKIIYSGVGVHVLQASSSLLFFDAVNSGYSKHYVYYQPWMIGNPVVSWLGSLCIWELTSGHSSSYLSTDRLLFNLLLWWLQYYLDCSVFVRCLKGAE